MALQGGQPRTTGVSDRWLLTRSAEQNSKLPGKLLLPEGREWLNISRVILLIPDVPVQTESVVQMLEALDLPRKTQIVLVELSSAHKSRSKRRHIDMLLACIQQTYPAAYRQSLYEPDWLAAMHAFTGRQDLLIAAAGQHLPQGPFTEESLSQVLLNRLNLPILEVSGIYPPWPSRLRGWIRRSLFNVFPFLVVGVFFWAQSQIGRQAQGWVSTFSIGMTVIVEFAVIFIWSLFLD
jgi:hypothetical protein